MGFSTGKKLLVTKRNMRSGSGALSTWGTNLLVHKSAMRNGIPPGYALSQNSAKMGVTLQVYTLNHVISVVKYKFCQITIYNDQCSFKKKNETCQ